MINWILGGIIIIVTVYSIIRIVVKFLGGQIHTAPAAFIVVMEVIDVIGVVAVIINI